MGYRVVKKLFDNMLSRFERIPERGGQTDRQNCYINIERQYLRAARDKKKYNVLQILSP